jgi:hypothetical protein
MEAGFELGPRGLFVHLKEIQGTQRRSVPHQAGAHNRHPPTHEGLSEARVFHLIGGAGLASPWPGTVVRAVTEDQVLEAFTSSSERRAALPWHLADGVRESFVDDLPDTVDAFSALTRPNASACGKCHGHRVFSSSFVTAQSDIPRGGLD